MNSKTLSNVRPAEDLDLLERSTKKKSKHLPRDPGASAMEISEGRVETEVDGSQETEPVEVVAETPLENQQALACATTVADHVEGSPSAMEDAPESMATPAPSNTTGDPPARSYLDSVEVEITVQNQAAFRNGATAGGGAAAGSSTKGSHPYGSWMIATRRERRQQGVQVGRQNEGGMQKENSRKGKEAAVATGSRYALLENAEENESTMGFVREVCAECGVGVCVYGKKVKAARARSGGSNSGDSDDDFVAPPLPFVARVQEVPMSKAPGGDLTVDEDVPIPRVSTRSPAGVLVNSLKDLSC
nr:uncharacterized protein LOC109193148 isoform X1 [Ipomoea batatas]